MQKAQQTKIEVDKLQGLRNDEQYKLIKNINNSGFGMIDVLLWLVVVAVVLSIIYGIFGGASTSTKKMKFLGELTMFQTKIREVYSGQPTGYQGINAEQVIKSHAYSTSLNATTTTLTSNDAGTVTISAPTDDSFSITYSAVPAELCQIVVPQLVSTGGWNSLEVNGSAIWGNAIPTPTKATIDTSCTGGSTVPITVISN